MSYKKLDNHIYVADTNADLRNIRGEHLGAKCYVIKEATEYILMSTGEWVNQAKSKGEAGNVDLTGYATEEYVDNAVKGIKVPSVAGLASQNYVDGKIEGVLDNPVFNIMGANNVNDITKERYGIYIKAADNKSIVEAMQEKGLGLYNFFVQKGSKDMPKKMVSDNSSGHGICCVDYYVRADEWAGYVLMFNKNNECYFRYISHGVAGPWMAVSAEEDK